MTVSPPVFTQRLNDRAHEVGLKFSAREAEQFERYYRLLERWNGRINLTALPLRDFPAATLDRLFIEPLVASKVVERVPLVWLDLGSGGGSPAIPLKILRPAAVLTMVDAKARKTAFLREAAHAAGLSATTVRTVRIEDLPAAVGLEIADLVTIRAVKLTGDIAGATVLLLKPSGQVLVFGKEIQTAPTGLRVLSELKLLNPGDVLTVLQRG